MTNQPRRILFLKTDDYDVSKSAASHIKMFKYLREQGHTADERSWLHPHPELGPLTLEDLKTYHAISFLVCYEYNKQIDKFLEFVENCVVPAQKGGVLVLNDPRIVTWNADKVYLKELEEDLGIRIPSTTFLDTVDGEVPDLGGVLSRHLESSSNRTGDVVIKPSISASSNRTYRVANPSSPSYDLAQGQAHLKEVYEYVHSLSSAAKVMIQSFEPGIKNGEYSIIFINDVYSHTILKTPAKDDFRAGWEFGATYKVVDEENVPGDGKEMGRKVIEYVKQKFTVDRVGYLRFDGVVRDDGKFAVMEAELIEPYLDLHREGRPTVGLERFCELLVGEP
ncbi:hypothetical protein ABW19_dt0203007 [Dactylella cylindrospora]|nr:hypothetical protein ABW19_dt0203007 [Dactylella cylindrospora]